MSYTREGYTFKLLEHNEGSEGIGSFNATCKHLQLEPKLPTDLCLSSFMDYYPKFMDISFSNYPDSSLLALDN